MKKISSIILALLFISLGSQACTSTGQETREDGNKPETESVINQENGDAAKAEPQFLTKETFKKKIWDYENNPQEWVYQGDQPAIIDFYADWCKPCKMVAPILAELSQDYEGKIKVYKIDTQVEKELAAVFQVSSIPTFLYIPVDGKPQLDRGYKDKATFERIINEVLLNN